MFISDINKSNYSIILLVIENYNKHIININTYFLDLGEKLKQNPY